MRTLRVTLLVLAGCFPLAGCYDPGYGYVRNGSGGDAYYGEETTTTVVSPGYASGYYDDGYGYGPDCCYSGVAVGAVWYDYGGRRYYRGRDGGYRDRDGHRGPPPRGGGGWRGDDDHRPPGNWQGGHPGGDRPGGWQGGRPGGDRPGGWQGGRPGGDRPGGWQGGRPGGDRPGGWQGGRPGGDRPGVGQGPRPPQSGGERPPSNGGDWHGGNRPSSNGNANARPSESVRDANGPRRIDRRRDGN